MALRSPDMRKGRLGQENAVLQGRSYGLLPDMDDPEAPSDSHPKLAQPRRNADYRWTVPKVAAFLRALSECGSVAEAARAVGMSRQAAYRLRARLDGEKFQAAFEDARRRGLAAKARARADRKNADTRPCSPWEGPGLDSLDHLRTKDKATQSET